MYAFLNGLPRSRKRSIVLIVDAVLAALAFYVALSLRMGTPWVLGLLDQPVLMLSLLGAAGAGFSWAYGVHQVKLHTFDNDAVLRLGTVALSLCATAMVASYVLHSYAPRSVPFIMAAVFLLVLRFCVSEGWLF